MNFDLSDPAIIGAVVTVLGGGLCALLGWLSKSLFDSVKTRVAKIEETQHQCLEGLPRCFAEKQKTERKIDEHDKRLDDHGERIVRVEERVSDGTHR